MVVVVVVFVFIVLGPRPPCDEHTWSLGAFYRWRRGRGRGRGRPRRRLPCL